MKITFGMIVFNGNQVLKECLQSVYPYAHQILIAEGPVSFWQDQGFSTSTDGTNKILDNFPDPDNKVKIVHGQYKEKDDQCNDYMTMIYPDADYIWNLDCDEIFKPQDIEKIIELLEQDKYTSVGFQSKTFYGGFDRYLTGFEENAEFIRIRKVYPGSYWYTHRPPTIAHTYDGPSGKEGEIVHEILPEKHLDYRKLAREHNVRMYHYSYVFPDQVYNKVKYYSECLNKKNTIDNYFNDVYLPWVLGKDEAKKDIENKYDGVHEWLPQSRGPCRTELFTGYHPEVIDLELLEQKFNHQLLKYI